MFFGSKKPAGETVLLVDVENGSVASSLLRLEGSERAKLYGTSRKQLALSRSVSAAELMHTVGVAAREVLRHTSEVAARMRGYQKLEPLGTTTRVEIFLAPPWTSLESSSGASTTNQTRWRHETPLVEHLSGVVSGLFGYIPTTLHPAARSVASVAQGLYPEEETLLLLNITGEVVEVLLAGQGAIQGRATLPLGHHHLLRTLKSHAGLSEAEARSAVRLFAQSGRHASSEAFGSAARHFAQEFKDTARDLLAHDTRTVIVIAPESSGEWYARSLASADGFDELFPRGGVVRALRSHHLAPHVDDGTKDLHLMLQALYVDSRSGSAVY